MRRAVLAALVVSTVVLAGCSASLPGTSDGATAPIRQSAADDPPAIDPLADPATAVGADAVPVRGATVDDATNVTPADDSGTDRAGRPLDGDAPDAAGATDAANGSRAVFDVRANVSVRANTRAVTPAAGQNGTGPKTSEELELHVDGTPAPGATVRVTVLRDDAPVTGARVLVDGETVGRTATDGSRDVSLPERRETTLRVERGSASVAVELVLG